MEQNNNNPAAIILAAGGSSRLGQPKQLLDWFGATFISKVIKTTIEAGLNPVIVVTGARHDLVEKEIEKHDVVIVRNTNWEKGQSTSLIAGVLKLVSMADKPFIFLLSDQPQVSVDLLLDLTRESEKTDSDIVTTAVEGQITPPILFKTKCINDILNLKGDQGGRKLVTTHPTIIIESEDKKILMDCDTIDDYNKLIKCYKCA